jgi:hypothetical protein
MTHIVPLSSAIFTSRIAVSLPRYAQIIEYAEPAFFGVNHPDNHEFECREIWSHEQRIAVYRALQLSQSELEKTVEYPLMPTWFGPERHDPGNPQILNTGRLIQMGQKKTVTHANVANTSVVDPAIFIHAVTVTDVDEVHIYHPGTDVEIYPSKIVIAGGVATITVPLVRMVAIAYEDTPPEGLDMADFAIWAEDFVDVVEEYLDPVLPPVEFISYDCASAGACPVETITDGCAYVSNEKLGIIKIGTFVDMCLAERAQFVDLYYQAGLADLTPHIEDIIVRFAHARMPNEPCGCDWLKARWRGDQLVPEMLTPERENCPFGMSNGAWLAWEFAQTSKQYRMGIL